MSSGSEGDEEDVGNVALLDIDVDDPKVNSLLTRRFPVTYNCVLCLIANR